MKCRKCKSLIDKLCQDELTAAESAALESHVKDCEPCRADYAAAMNLTRGDLALTPPGLSPSFTAQVMKHLAGGFFSTARRDKALKIKSPHRSRRKLLNTYAAAAAIFILALTAVFLWTEHREEQERPADQPTIQAAIQTAISAASNGYIVIAANGTYTGTQNLPNIPARVEAENQTATLIVPNEKGTPEVQEIMEITKQLERGEGTIGAMDEQAVDALAKADDETLDHFYRQYREQVLKKLEERLIREREHAARTPQAQQPVQPDMPLEHPKPTSAGPLIEDFTLLKVLRNVLTPNAGKLEYDYDKNSIIIIDTKPKLKEMEKLINMLDTPLNVGITVERPAVSEREPMPKVTIKMQDADLALVLDQLATLSGANIVIAPDVKGTVSINLRNVPWRTAFDTIIKTLGYAVVEEDDNILRVVRPEALQAQLETQMFKLRYIRPPDPYKAILEAGAGKTGRGGKFFVSGVQTPRGRGPEEEGGIIKAYFPRPSGGSDGGTYEFDLGHWESIRDKFNATGVLDPEEFERFSAKLSSGVQTYLDLPRTLDKRIPTPPSENYAGRIADARDTVMLKNGGKVVGQIIREKDGKIQAKTRSGQTVEINLDDIDKIAVPEGRTARLSKLRDFGIPVDRIVIQKPPPAIDGKVVAYDPPTRLVLLSVGEKDGVKEDYEFTIYRGRKFIARAKVAKVLDDMCGARILFKVADIKTGDLAATKLSRTRPRKKTWKRRGKPTFARVYVGGGNSLELVRMSVSVAVEGPRARTVIDHIFRNPHNQQLQGTFEYPLPAGASPCYYAMFIGRQTPPTAMFRRGSELPANLPELSPQEIVAYVEKKYWGEPKEARIVKRETARKAYEEIVRRKIDPALLEYASANTFRGRVFPIPSQGYNRVIIAYEQTLESTGDAMQYRFPLPDCELESLNFALAASTTDCKNPALNRKDMDGSEKEGKLLYAGEWSKEGPGGETVFSFNPPRKDIQCISGQDGTGYYFYAHLRPHLSEEKAAAYAKHAVFLLDTSLSEEPDRFNTSVALLTKILESDSTIEKFQVLLFDVGARWLLPSKGFWLRNSAKGRKSLLAQLDSVLLEGATDLSGALEKIASEKALAGKPVNIFLLSDGQVNWGRTDANQVVARFEGQAKFPYRFFCYRTGLSAENLELFGLLTRRGGSTFNCFSEDMVKNAALAHRRHCLQVTDVSADGASELLVAGRKGAIYPGGEMIVAGRCAKPGEVHLKLTGTFKGKEVKYSFPVRVSGAHELAPRAWGEIAVASLVALNDPEMDELITAYCQHFSIGSKVASFLILETERDYKRFDISDELGEINVKDIAEFLDSRWIGAGKELTAKEKFERFITQMEERLKLTSGGSGEYVKKLLEALSEADYELPKSTTSGKMVLKGSVPASYLKARSEKRRDVGIYTEETVRRTKDAASALRALSCVVELYPGRADALRLVGYRLLAMGEPADAVGLFERVQDSRPFEPQSYRDLARSFELVGKPGLAAVQYEILLAGRWHTRFRSLKQVVLEEYCLLMRSAVRENRVSKRLSDLFAARLAALAGSETKADLRVTMSWNTDNTDIDLWVIEPGGEKCFYRHKVTKNGGKLLDDLTEGYGPERYQMVKAGKGLYTVKVHYYDTNPNLLGGETYVTVTVTKFAGTERQDIRRYNVILKEESQAIEVCRIEF